jgi:peptidylamidoglycolate lyase
MTMRLRLSTLALASSVALVLMPGLDAQKGGEDETGPYELVASWPRAACGDGFGWGSTSGVFAESPDAVFVFQRGCLPTLPAFTGIVPPRNASNFAADSPDPLLRPRWEHVLMVVNREGRVVDSWNQHNHLFVRPHRVLISPYDPDRAVWLIDDGAHQVFKFSRDGKRLLMTLGEHKVPGNDRAHFNRPTDVAWLPNGDFFVTDGYANTRVVKFSKDGRYLFEWGKPGAGPGEFNTVHGIVIDDKRRLYIADRGNSRVQIFDEHGTNVDEWPNIRFPYAIYISKDQHVWIGDGYTNKILKYDLNGKLLYSWGTFGAFPGGLWGPHQISVDNEDNLYIADVHIGRVQKLRPKRGADRAHLVGQR